MSRMNRGMMGRMEIYRSIRKTWAIKPFDRIHEGKKDQYHRAEQKRIERDWSEE